MLKFNKIKDFFKSFIDRCKNYYATYSIITSTTVFTLFLILLSDFLGWLVLIEIIILTCPLVFFYFFFYKQGIDCECFYYVEKHGKHKTTPQLMNKKQNEIIIFNSKKYILYYQLNIGKIIRSYEIYWDKKIDIEITLHDKPAFLIFEDDKVICQKNQQLSFILAIEFLYIGSEQLDIEFPLYSKVKGKTKIIWNLNVKLR